jgi:hypothetical protein
MYEGSEFSNTGGLEDGFAISIDEDGKSRCGLGFHGNGQERVRQVHLNADGSLFALVSLTESLEIEGVSYNAQGSADLLIVKTCLPCDTLTGIKETSLTQDVALEIYPNPTATQTKLTYHTPQGAHPTLQLTDMLGRVVQTVQLPTNEGSYTLDASTLGTGVYFCTLLSGAEVLATQKLSVIKNE